MDPPPRIDPPTPSNYDLGSRDLNSFSPSCGNEEDSQSPLAIIAKRTQKARRAAAKLHKKVSRNFTAQQRTQTIEMATLDTAPRPITPQQLPSNQLTSNNLATRNKGRPKQRVSANRESMDSNMDTKDQPGKPDKQGFLSDLFQGTSTSKPHQQSPSSSNDGTLSNGAFNAGCTKYTKLACQYVSKSSAAWHDERYGKMTNSAWLMQMTLCLIICLLVLFDTLKIVNHKEGIRSTLKDKTNPTQETAEKSFLFFIPCGLIFATFLIGFVLVKRLNEEDKEHMKGSTTPIKALRKSLLTMEANALPEHPASIPHLHHNEARPNIRLKKIILALFYISIAVTIVITEISTGWYGFMDSSIWVLVGWVGTMSPFGFRGSFSVNGVIMCCYAFSLLLGSGLSVLSSSTILKLGQLVLLLYIPNVLVGVFIELQIEQAARLSIQEAEGVEELEEQLQYGKKLLETVLPKGIITFVKNMSQVEDAAIAHKYDCCTITFIKFVGIHHMFENEPTVRVMETVDKLYRKIDRLTDVHLVEKIKTVGDVYMAATGIPNETDAHALIMADFCFDVAESVRHFSSRLKKKISGGKKVPLSFQIGISSGPIVAGVIGKNKFTYDLWGDGKGVVVGGGGGCCCCSGWRWWWVVSLLLLSLLLSLLSGFVVAVGFCRCCRYCCWTHVALYVF